MADRRLVIALAVAWNVAWCTPVALVGAFVWFVAGSHTQYAEQYKDAAFRKIDAGAPEHAVHSLVGRPLFETPTLWPYRKYGRPNLTRAEMGSDPPLPSGSRFLWYSQPGPLHFAYELRVIEVSAGEVARTYSSFHWD